MHEARVEAEIANEPYKWYPQRAGRVDLVVSRAKETGAWSDPVVRQEIAKLLTMSRSDELDGAPRGAQRNASANHRVPRVRSANSPAATSRARHRTCTR